MAAYRAMSHLPLLLHKSRLRSRASRLSWAVALTVALCVATSATSVARAAAPLRPLPTSMAAMGDSISLAFNTHTDPATVPFPPDGSGCPDGQGGLTGFPFDCPEHSWSTGTSPSVQSMYLRLAALNPEIVGHQHNDAVSGVKVSDLGRQASVAVSQAASFVTVNIGINDACTPTISDETTLADFRVQFQAAMTTLAASPTRPLIEVISIPNVFREWQLFRNDSNAQFRWGLAGICQAMFANPTSMLPADFARRLTVLARIISYNVVEAEICARTPRCHSDGGAVFAWPFTAADISTVANTGRITNVPALANFPVFGPGIPNSTGDYFHPSTVGQAAIADIAWRHSVFRSDK